MHSQFKPGQQSGVALFISLVLLLVLTIIGVSSVQTTSLEVRMTRNEHDSMLAFQAAESALEDGEQEVFQLTTPESFGITSGRYLVADVGEPYHYQRADIWDGGSSTEAPTEVEGVAQQPRYILEHVATVVSEENAHQLDDPYGGGAQKRIEVYRITAMGVGGTENARVVLQSIFGALVE